MIKSSPPARKIVIVAGESSGDMHAAHLVEALKELRPNLTFSGLGGPRMATQGVQLHYDMTQIAVVGFWEILKHFAQFKRIFRDLLARMDQDRPDAIILVDYPGFNLRLARKCHERGIPVIYYISPQVWAWKKKRVELIRRIVDKMLVIFEFEREFYQKHGIDAPFVGHPLVDMLHDLPTKEDALSALGLDDYKLTIGILPGSRQQEIERHMPVMMRTAAILQQKYPMTQFLIIKAPAINAPDLQRYIPEELNDVRVVTDDHYQAIQACTVCLVKSGTSTLETGMLGKPMVVIYKTSLLTWLLVKWFVRIPHLALINVLGKKGIVPELIQGDAQPRRIAQELEAMFTNDERMNEIREDLLTVRRQLGNGQANYRAAEEILKVLDGS